MAGLEPIELKLPLVPVPDTKPNGKAIVSRRNCYIQFTDAKHNVRNSIYIEKRKHKDGTTTFVNKSFLTKKKSKANTPRQLLNKLGIEYKPQSVRLVKA